MTEEDAPRCSNWRWRTRPTVTCEIQLGVPHDWHVCYKNGRIFSWPNKEAAIEAQQ